MAQQVARTVVFLDRVHEVLETRLTEAGYDCIDATELPPDDCKEALSSAFGLVIRSRFRMDAAWLDGARGLQFIARSGAGMENIDLEYCQSRGIALFNAPEGNRNAVAEHALGMLLGLFNRLNAADREVRQGVWDREGNRGIELAGKTVGIIGYGNNGSQFAEVLSGFDVEILAYDKYKSGFGSARVREVAMEEIFSQADVLSLHIPQTVETLGMVDETYINRFNKPIYLINLSRGRIVKTEALIQGLDNGRVLGACLDVLEYEKSSFEDMFDAQIPPPFKALISSDKVMLTPHVGGWTVESYYKLSEVLADKILAHFSSET